MSWSDVFERTWLVDGGVVTAIDDYVRRRMIVHRGLPADHPAPATTSVDRLVEDTRRLAMKEQWAWAISSLGFMSELIICAELGTPSIRRAILHHERNTLLDGLGVAITPVILLRNVFAHPASSAGERDRFPDLFVAWCNANAEVDLARSLRDRWHVMGNEDVFIVALRRLDAAGPILRRLK